MIDRRIFSGGLAISAASTLFGCSNAGPNSTASLSVAPIGKDIPGASELAKEGPLGDVWLGHAEAPVTVYEYVSLTCPFSRKFHLETYPAFKKDFVDTGKVRFVVREFPIGRSAAAAAVVTRAVPKEKFFLLHEKFLMQQKMWTAQKVRPDAIFEVARQVGMSRETFDTAINDQTVNDGLVWVKQRGRELGVTGTPTFFANDQKRRGALTYAELLQLVSV